MKYVPLLEAFSHRAAPTNFAAVAADTVAAAFMADPPLCAGYGTPQIDFDLSGLDVASTPATPEV